MRKHEKIYLRRTDDDRVCNDGGKAVNVSTQVSEHTHSARHHSNNCLGIIFTNRPLDINADIILKNKQCVHYHGKDRTYNSIRTINPDF